MVTLRPSYFGFETIDELRDFVEGVEGETIGEFASRIAGRLEERSFVGERKKAASAMLCFLSDVVGDEAIGEKMQQLINRFFKLLSS